jgi:hypothetical protein
MDMWEKLQSLLPSPNVEEKIVNLLKTLDEPQREELMEEVRYNLGGDAVERISCRLMEVSP